MNVIKKQNLQQELRLVVIVSERTAFAPSFLIDFTLRADILMTCLTAFHRLFISA